MEGKQGQEAVAFVMLFRSSFVFVVNHLRTSRQTLEALAEALIFGALVSRDGWVKTLAQIANYHPSEPRPLSFQSSPFSVKTLVKC